MKFVVAAQRSQESMSALCARFGISRKTGYKLLNRFSAEGPEGLRDRSSAPGFHPNRTPPETETAVLRVRKGHPTWGSKKILATLQREAPSLALPARSTVDAILKRAGVVEPKCRRRRGRRSFSPPVVDAQAPNAAWSIDYKGWFRVGDKTRCDPLTVNDVFSRASLVLRALVSPKLEDVKSQLEAAFHSYGLPSMMLSDNGPPFGSVGIHGLSRLSVWLIRLGVKPVFIQPGRPDQNGRHERFHETLKAETAKPPRRTISAQQRSFDDFQVIYNEERPHEALDMKVPAEVYDLSDRVMPRELPEYAYSDTFERRRVRRDGTINWAGRYVSVGEAFRGEILGLEAVDEDLHHVHLGAMRLGALSRPSRCVVPLAGDLQ